MNGSEVRPVKKKMSKAALTEHRWGLAFVAPPFIGFLLFMAFFYRFFIMYTKNGIVIKADAAFCFD